MITCIAIDDEPLALSQISTYIKKTDFLILKGACKSANEATKIISENEIDLLFVDINMPDINGLDFVRDLQNKPIIIFTTAYSEFAIDSFRVDALDYLLKPFSYTDFLHSAEKALKQFQLLTSSLTNQIDNEQWLFVKSEHKILQINVLQINYIESRSEYLRIYSENIQPVMTLSNMKSMLEKLPTDLFMQIHRSYIVNLKKIISVERNFILLKNNVKIPIGEHYKENFIKYLNRNIL
jgi:two-component system LytT family response regulator